MGMKTKIVALSFLLSIFFLLCATLVSKWRQPQERTVAQDVRPAPRHGIRKIYVRDHENKDSQKKKTLKTPPSSIGDRSAGRFRLQGEMGHEDLERIYRFGYRLFERKSRKLEFSEKMNGQETPRYIFNLLIRTIDNIMSDVPYHSGGLESFGLESKEIEAVKHYIQRLRTCILHLDVVYNRASLKPNRTWLLYSGTVDSLVGTRVTKYHNGRGLSKDESSYMSYVKQFISKDAASIGVDGHVIVKDNGPDGCMSIKHHMACVIVEYIINFYVEAETWGGKSDARRDMVPLHFNDKKGDAVRPSVAPHVNMLMYLHCKIKRLSWLMRLW